MTTAVLCKNVTAVQSAPVNQGLASGTTIGTTTPPPGTGLPPGSSIIQPNTDWSNVTNPLGQTFQVVVTCTSGNCSASVQVMGSNDGLNWSSYGSAIAVTSGVSPNIGSATGSNTWEYFTAYVTAISGTGTAVQCTMST